MRLLWGIFLSLWFLFGLTFLNQMDIRIVGKKKILKEINTADGYPFVMVLGAGRNYSEGRPNYSFQGRMKATALFWKTHPHIKLILSGIKDEWYYNEPIDMLQALKKLEIPEEVCILDDKSKDTYESILWYKSSFGRTPVIIISQEEHLERSLWLAQKAGLNAVGYAAPGFPHGTPLWLQYREYGARIKARLEIWGLIKP
ncbi:hypothetical protein BH11BAC2_BH11BAC2_09310 [soil metagenome]